MIVKKAIRRVDAGLEDHRHRLPNGEYTGGMLAKPTKDTSMMHSHLYEHDEGTAETMAMHDFPGHTHKFGLEEETSPSVPMQKKPGQPWQKMDSLQREGTEYILRSITGSVIGRGATPSEAVKHYDSYDADETLAKHTFSHAIGEDIDESKWEKAKQASQSSVGAVKWPLVQHIYQQMV